MDRTNRFAALGSPAPKNTSSGAKTTLARSTRLEAPLLQSIIEKLGGVNMTCMLEAVGDIIIHIQKCIEDLMKRPNFEPTDLFLGYIGHAHQRIDLLAAAAKGERCKNYAATQRSYRQKEGETQTKLETIPPLSFVAIVSKHSTKYTPSTKNQPTSSSTTKKPNKVHRFSIQKRSKGVQYQPPQAEQEASNIISESKNIPERKAPAIWPGSCSAWHSGDEETWESKRVDGKGEPMDGEDCCGKMVGEKRKEGGKED